MAQQPAEQLNVAILGSRGHWNILTRELSTFPQLKVTAVSPANADPIDGMMQVLKDAGQSPEVMEDWQKALDTKPDIAVICGPFDQHAEMTVAAMDRGIHVIVEKAVALTLEDLAKVEAAIARNPGVHMAPMSEMRFFPGVLHAKKLALDGTLGDVRLMNTRKSYRMGTRAPYYHDRATYGGTIPWVGAHAVDWIVFLMGTEIKSITALHSAVANEGHGSFERAAQIQIAYSRGRMASASIDVFRPVAAPTHGDDWIRVVGTTGTLEARQFTVQQVGADEVKPEPTTTFMADFIGHITGKRPTILSMEDSLVVTRALLLARESADTGEIRRF